MLLPTKNYETRLSFSCDTVKLKAFLHIFNFNVEKIRGTLIFNLSLLTETEIQILIHHFSYFSFF